MEISKANGQMDTALANISQRTSETQASLNIQTDRSQGQEGDDGQQRGVSEKLADITKKLKGSFSLVNPSSNIRRLERFFNNDKFDIYSFFFC